MSPLTNLACLVAIWATFAPGGAAEAWLRPIADPASTFSDYRRPLATDRDGEPKYHFSILLR
jgi:hypothetical protein